MFNEELQNKTYYLCDNPHIDVVSWANLISKHFGVSQPKCLSLSLLKVIALGGDLLKKFGYKNPPLSSFRLNNLITDMVYDISELETICGKLPYTLDEGVKITVDWMAAEKKI